MTAARPMIACLGAGRMGRGIAVAFAYAGHAVTMIDIKARPGDQFAVLEAEALGEVSKTLASLARFGLLAESDADAVVARVSVVPAQNTAAALANAGIVFEGVPEVVVNQNRGRGRPRNASGPTSSSPRPHQRFWLTISQARSRIPSDFSTCTG